MEYRFPNEDPVLFKRYAEELAALKPDVLATVTRPAAIAMTQATKTIPIGVSATREFVEEVAGLAGVDATAVLASSSTRLPWYSRSVDSTYLTGKRVFIFGDATHAVAAAPCATAATA